MADAPVSLLAILIAVVLAAITGASVARLRNLRQGIAAIAAGAFLLLSSFVLALFQNTTSDIQRVFTFRNAEEPFFIAGYVWGEYGIILGAIVGTLVIHWRKSHGEQHDA